MDPELRVDQLTDHLRAYLPVAIDLVNSDGGVQLAKPENDHYFAGGRDLIPPDLHPAVEVAVSQTDTFNLDIASREGDTNYPMAVVVHCHHEDYDALWRSMYRYGRAVAMAGSMRRVLTPSSVTQRVQAFYGIELDDGGREHPVWIAKPRILLLIETTDETGGIL